MRWAATGESSPPDRRTSALPLEPTGSPPAPRSRSAETSSSLLSTSTNSSRSGRERSTSSPRRTRTASPISRASSTERSAKRLSRRRARTAKVRPGRPRSSSTAAWTAAVGSRSQRSPGWTTLTPGSARQRCTSSSWGSPPVITNTPPRWRTSSGSSPEAARRRLRSSAPTNSGRFFPFRASSPNLSSTQGWASAIRQKVPGLLVLVQGLAGQLGPARAVEADLDVVARVGIERHEREAVVHERALVGGGRAELGRGRRPVRHQRHAPYERDHPAPPLGPAPVADLLVREVERPVRVLSGGLLGEVRRRLEVHRLGALVLARVGDVPEHLALAGGSGGRHVGASGPGAVREPADRCRVELLLGRARELLAERLGPAAVGQGLLRRLGGEQRHLARDGRHGGGETYRLAPRSPRAASSGASTFRCTPVPISRPASCARRGITSMRQQKRSASRGAVRTHMLSGGRAPSTAPRRDSASCSMRAPSGPSSENRAAGRRGTTCMWKGTRAPNGQNATASSSIATTRSRRFTSSCTRSSSRLRPCVRSEYAVNRSRSRATAAGTNGSA